MEISLAKLKAIILFLAQNTDPKFLVKRYGLPITGDNYINMEHGPVPSTIKNLVYSVAAEPNEALLADTINIDQNPSSMIHKIVPSRAFTDKDRDLLNDSEMEILEEISKRFYSANKETIEKAAHQEAPWATTVELEPIPYWLAAKDADSRFTEDEIKFYTSL